MLQATPLIADHQLIGAKLVDFSGWQMPLHYGSQIQEHHTVRQDAGMFDVSHMAIVDVAGKNALDYLRYLLANDILKLNQSGKALYTCMLNEQGGVVDDLIVYKFAEDHYRLVLNAGTREKDWHWLLAQKHFDQVELKQRTDLGMIAIQGPQASAKIMSLLATKDQEKLLKLKPFNSVLIDGVLYSRTGYTGEDGMELHIPNDQLSAYWQKYLKAGIKPCGLGARDTLRLEAGLNLYGIDMDETTTPLESNLTWTVAFEPKDRLFIGRGALEQQRGTNHLQLVGIILESAGVLRSQQRILVPHNGEGVITSGTFSPTLGHAIALARLPITTKVADANVEIRNKTLPVHLVRPPFVRKGKKVCQALI